MQRWVITVLMAIFVAVLPLWPFDRHWGYGPAITVGFLLLINLLMVLGEHIGGAPDKP